MPKPIHKARPATRTKPEDETPKDLATYLDEARGYCASTHSRQRLLDDAIELVDQALDEAVRWKRSEKQHQLDNDILAMPLPRSAKGESDFVLGIVGLAFALQRAAGRFATAAIVKANAGPKRRRQQEIYVAWNFADIGVDALAGVYGILPAAIIADRVAELGRWRNAPRDVDGHRNFAVAALKRLSKTAHNRGFVEVASHAASTAESLR
jgi:hypothetical protein